MSRHRKLTRKFAGFPMFKLASSGETFPVTSPFTTGFTGLETDQLALDLQFAADKTLTARKGPTPVFTRGSTGTFVDSDGLIKYAAENRLVQSENFTTSWSNSTGFPVIINAALSPIGDLTADQIDFPLTNTVGFQKTVSQNFSTTLAGSNAVTASVWLRTISGTATVYISLTDGTTVPTRSNAACNVTTEWQRFSVTLNNPLYTLTFLIGPDTRTTAGSPAQPFPQQAASVYAWGAQLERSSTARTYIPTTTAAVYGPRFDHDPVTGVCKGLLMEESRTNACINSNLLTSTSWISVNTTVIVDAAGPDGTNVFELAETTASASHSHGNSGGPTSTLATSVVSGSNYTASVFLKKVSGGPDWIQLSLGSSGFGSVQFANFNLNTGAAGNSSGMASGFPPKIEVFANGWYRCSITVTANATTATSTGVIIYFTNNINAASRSPTYLGNVNNKILVGMGQFEAGSFPTSYIPTTTASVIRSADVCSISGSNFTSFYNTTEGSFATSSIFNAPTTVVNGQVVFDINDTTTLNRTRILRNATNGVLIHANNVGGVQDVAITGSTAIVAGSVTKISGCMKANDFTVYLNNVSQGVDTTAILQSAPTTFTIGDASLGLATRVPINGTIASMQYYKKRLANAKLQALTV